MPDVEQLRESALSSETRAARHQLAAALSQALTRHGQVLHVTGNIIGRGRVEGTSPRGNGDDRSVAVGFLAQAAGQLLQGAQRLVEDSHFYAAAALSRQIVETENFLWAFANDHEDAAKWLNSSAEERRARWQPRHLRHRSNGVFLGADYSAHCERGGHPTPDGISSLINTTDPAMGEVVLVDALGHAVGCWHSATKFEAAEPSAAVVDQLIARWPEHDTLVGGFARSRKSDGA